MIKRLSIFLLLGFYLLTPGVALAKVDCSDGKPDHTVDKDAKVLGTVPSIWRNVDPCNLKMADVPKIITNAALILLFFGGFVSLIMIVVGGIQYIMSAGNPDMLQVARTTLVYAISGFILCVASYAIVGYIVGSITK